MEMVKKKSHSVVLYNFWAAILVAIGFIEEKPKEQPEKPKEPNEEVLLLTNRVDIIPTEQPLLFSPFDLPLSDEAEAKPEDEPEQAHPYHSRLQTNIRQYEIVDFFVHPQTSNLPPTESFYSLPKYKSLESSPPPIFPSYFRKPATPEMFESDDVIVNELTAEPVVSAKSDDIFVPPEAITAEKTDGSVLTSLEPINEPATPELITTPKTTEPIVAPTDSTPAPKTAPLLVMPKRKNDNELEVPRDESRIYIIEPDNGKVKFLDEYPEPVDTLKLEKYSILTVEADLFEAFLKYHFEGRGTIHFTFDVDESRIITNKIADTVKLEETIEGQDDPVPIDFSFMDFSMTGFDI